jgi:hypothetical protein
MKKLIALTVTALALTASAFAQTNETPVLSPDQIAKLNLTVDSLVPLVPMQYQSMAVHAIALLGMLAFAVRAYIGWRNNGIPGALAGIFGGTNTPQNVATTSHIAAALNGLRGVTPYPVKPGSDASGGVARGVVLLFVFSAALAMTGCTGYQVTEADNGTGFKAAVTVPIPFSGGESFLQTSFMGGTWKHGSILQPTSTNAIHSTSVAINMGETAGASVGGTAGSMGGTNGVAAIGANDKAHFNVLTGQSATSFGTNGFSTTTDK